MSLHEDLIADLVSVLHEVETWELPQARWEPVRALVEAVDDALRSGDLERVRAAVVDLALAGPVRITRIGEVPVAPVPPQLRERTNRLVHALQAIVPHSRRPGASAGEGQR
jgi:hypothetical protein